MRSLEKARLIQIALLSLFLTACGGGGPVTTSTPTTLSTTYSSMGTDFYLTLPDHLCVSDPALCNNTPVTNKLIIASPTATSGEVTFNGTITAFSVLAGGQTEIVLDPATVLTTNESVEAKGIHVTSVAPVSVHVVSENTTSAEGYLALPTAGLGTNYYVMSTASANFNGSEFAVVATQDNTLINVTPAASGATRPAGTPFTITLNTGETYQFSNTANGDMTGTNIIADKPIAVFGGHRCAEVPSGLGYCDYLVEQLPDVSMWGTTHHTVPFSGRSRYTVRVMASQDGTTFSAAPAGMPTTLNAGQFADVVLSGVGEFLSSGPVLVAQFMHGYADDAAGKGDPSMVLVTPTAVADSEKGVTDSTFAVHGLAGTSGSFINIVTETATLMDLNLDNAAVNTALFTPVNATSLYSSATLPVTPGVHTLHNSAPYSAFVYDYGTAGNAVSYAYPTGGTLVVTNPVPVQPPVQPPVPAPDPVPNPPVCVDDHDLDDAESHNGAEHHGRGKHGNESNQGNDHHGEEDDDDHECHDD